MSRDERSLLAHLLTEEGYHWEEITNMIDRLNEHDDRTIRDSIFDSFGQDVSSFERLVGAVK